MVRQVLRFGGLLVMMLALAGCALLPTGRSQGPAAAGPTPTAIPTPIVPTKPTYEVQRGEVVKRLQFLGRIAPVTEASLFFRTAGRVRTVYAKRSDLVTAGQVLADLEIDTLERELASARLELERAQVRLVSAETDLENAKRRAEVNLEIAELNLLAVQAHDPSPRKAQAEAELERAKVAVQHAQEAYNGVAWRADVAATSEAANLQQATLNYTQAQATYDMAMQEIATHQYDVAIKKSQVELAQISLDELESGVDPLLENDVQRALLNTQKLEAAIADAQIVAPFDGQILSLALSEGRSVDGFQAVVIVADPSQLEVSADLVSSQMQQLAEGMPVEVVLVSRPGEQLAGQIRRLPYPYSGGGHSVGVDEEDQSTRVSLDASASEAGYELGDMCRVTVTLEQRADVLWLPPQAIRTFEGRKFVVVQDGEAQRRVDVKVGIQGEDRVEILEGLTEGQIVIGQ